MCIISFNNEYLPVAPQKEESRETLLDLCNQDIEEDWNHLCPSLELAVDTTF